MGAGGLAKDQTFTEFFSCTLSLLAIKLKSSESLIVTQKSKICWQHIGFMNHTIFQKSLVTSLLHFDEHPSLLKNISNTDTSKLPHTHTLVRTKYATTFMQYFCSQNYYHGAKCRKNTILHYALNMQK